jgi:hypothetical protein
MILLHTKVEWSVECCQACAEDSSHPCSNPGHMVHVFTKAFTYSMGQHNVGPPPQKNNAAVNRLCQILDSHSGDWDVTMCSPVKVH